MVTWSSLWKKRIRILNIFVSILSIFIIVCCLFMYEWKWCVWLIFSCKWNLLLTDNDDQNNQTDDAHNYHHLENLIFKISSNNRDLLKLPLNFVTRTFVLISQLVVQIVKLLAEEHLKTGWHQNIWIVKAFSQELKCHDICKFVY